VFDARFEATEVDERIVGVLARYRDWSVPVMWMTVPSTQPMDLGAQLQRYGFERRALRTAPPLP
jgi:hypothetical protein